jgi:hypothetical protein
MIAPPLSGGTLEQGQADRPETSFEAAGDLGDSNALADVVERS